jgi:shikimate kinase
MVIGLPASYRNLIITGYGASNHPRLVSQMASALKRPFVDVEALIEQRLGESMEETRQMYGERHMKANIAEVMSNVLLYRGTVIRIHGSTLASGDYLARMQETGIVVCLIARLDAILQRYAWSHAWMRFCKRCTFPLAHAITTHANARWLWVNSNANGPCANYRVSWNWMSPSAMKQVRCKM